MSVETVTVGLANVEQLFVGSGVTHVFTDAPNSISPADLPCFVNIPGRAVVKWGDGGSDELYTAALETRTYHCLLLAVPRAAGVSGEVVRLTKPVFAIALQTFQGHQSLIGVKGIMKVTYVGDSGIRELFYAGQPYLGADFQVDVTERVRVPYAAGE